MWSGWAALLLWKEHGSNRRRGEPRRRKRSRPELILPVQPSVSVHLPRLEPGWNFGASRGGSAGHSSLRTRPVGTVFRAPAAWSLAACWLVDHEPQPGIKTCTGAPQVSLVLLEANWWGCRTQSRVLGGFLWKGLGFSSLFLFLFLSVPVTHCWDSSFEDETHFIFYSFQVY